MNDQTNLIKKMQKAIDDFCEGQDWASQNWKDQDHIKELFNLRTIKTNKKNESKNKQTTS